MAQLSLKDLLDSGVHFGHQRQRWNPKMKPFIFGERNGVHIIDLQKTLEYAQRAAHFVRELAAQGGRLLWVGTKKQAQEAIKEAAYRTSQPYVIKRWLGGTLTNFETIRASIDRLRKIDQMRQSGELMLFTKKERAQIEKKYLKASEYLEGIREMKSLPDALFVVDVPREIISIREARRMGIPVVGILDTNGDPSLLDYPIPGNDDSIRSIQLLTQWIAEAFIEGQRIYQERIAASVDKAVEVVEPKESSPKSRRPGPRRPASEGASQPEVVKVPRRRLVAAGLAESIEIEAEIQEKENQFESLDENQ